MFHPFRFKECFAFFDEARSRGADLKLAMTARAMVTWLRIECKVDLCTCTRTKVSVPIGSTKIVSNKNSSSA